MRELCILSSWRIQFSAPFDELVRVYAWWMDGDERANRINESSAKGKRRDPESFTMSVREDTHYHTVLIIHTLYAQTHLGSHSRKLSWQVIYKLWDGTWDPLEAFDLLNGNASPFFFPLERILEAWEQGSSQMSRDCSQWPQKIMPKHLSIRDV